MKNILHEIPYHRNEPFGLNKKFQYGPQNSTFFSPPKMLEYGRKKLYISRFPQFVFEKTSPL